MQLIIAYLLYIVSAYRQLFGLRIPQGYNHIRDDLHRPFDFHHIHQQLVLLFNIQYQYWIMQSQSILLNHKNLILFHFLCVFNCLNFSHHFISISLHLMIQPKNFQRTANSSKWQNKLQSDSYSLTLADMDIPLYKPFHQKLLSKIVNANNFTYKQRNAEYFKSLINWQMNHYLTQGTFLVSKNHIVSSPSVCNLFACSILAFSQPQDFIMIMTPTYSYYKDAIQTGGRKIIFTQMKIQKQFINKTEIYSYQFDTEDFQQKIHDYKPKILVLCNPHNPGGKLFTKKQINFMIEQSKIYNCIIFSDQILADFAIFNSDSPVPFYSVLNSSYEKVVVGNSISKSFNCSSIQGGYGIIKCPKLKQKFNKISLKMFKHLTNETALLMTPIVYSNDGQVWLRQVNKLVKQNYNYFKQNVKNSKLKVFDLTSTYLMVVNLQNYQTKHLNATQIKKYLNSKKIYLLSMDAYFQPTRTTSYYRIAIAVDFQFFKKFVDSFVQTLKELQKASISQIFPKL